ncbi:hypothetical protein PCASD_21922, partial [Puccinia coronata f. sp. avenae]
MRGVSRCHGMNHNHLNVNATLQKYPTEARKLLAEESIHTASTRHYARLTLIGNLVSRCKSYRAGDKEPMVALKVATVDPIGREAREAGKEPTSSFHDVLSFNAGLNKYLAEFKKG